jgi:hypothetical protein
MKNHKFKSLISLSLVLTAVLALLALPRPAKADGACDDFAAICVTVLLIFPGSQMTYYNCEEDEDGNIASAECDFLLAN